MRAHIEPTSVKRLIWHHSNGRLLTLSINIRLMNVSGKYYSLLRYGNNCCRKNFYSSGPSALKSSHRQKINRPALLWLVRKLVNDFFCTTLGHSGQIEGKKAKKLIYDLRRKFLIFKTFFRNFDIVHFFDVTWKFLMIKKNCYSCIDFHARCLKQKPGKLFFV